MTVRWRKRDVRLAAEALALLVAARVGLWVLPFATVRRLLHAVARPGRASPRGADHLAWSLAAAARRLPSTFRDCLPLALAADAMLRRRGAPSELVIGVRRASATGRVEAHAWVVSGERVVTGWLDDLPSYLPLASPTGPGR